MPYIHEETQKQICDIAEKYRIRDRLYKKLSFAIKKQIDELVYIDPQILYDFGCLKYTIENTKIDKNGYLLPLGEHG